MQFLEALCLPDGVVAATELILLLSNRAFFSQSLSLNLPLENWKNIFNLYFTYFDGIGPRYLQGNIFKCTA
jgi:hypothetical protein